MNLLLTNLATLAMISAQLVSEYSQTNAMGARTTSLTMSEIFTTISHALISALTVSMVTNLIYNANHVVMNALHVSLSTSVLLVSMDHTS